MSVVDVAVIGAGWSGLTAASRLAARGLSVCVLEKSRGPGGRSATRREDGLAFDHGAQYFTARSDAFRRRVSVWEQAGLVAEWQPRLRVLGPRPNDLDDPPQRRLVAVPGMNGLIRRLADGLDCRYSCRLTSARFERQWQLETEVGKSLTARALLLTAPPAQSAELLGEGHALYPTLSTVPMQPCWAVMLGWDETLPVEFDAAFVNQGALTWLARNNSKPGRSGGESWVLHASDSWSEANLEEEPGRVIDSLYEALISIDAGFGKTPRIRTAHRWRYAMARRAMQKGCLVDGESRVVVAGDWCSGSRIEGAWTSGVAADRMLASLLL
ncbi:FAD-dependent oxidoreductase [Wenzhouxiangella sp. AB-CW3]|uniref:NAD(P)/FAD-dependent oxidoreductase n=1 Tax=Wenzhouxiangella sp. AB-CW3 TaxID=2771012 RepID=UPI00168A576B|nr:FAD-dependent oxidoreductase [Wenzhouxiangella sp. AB-CW3]QOC21171.1 FAD-dependent oxidoreductase [Wenzhouxiangella sp. AB-CW3]